MKLDVDSGFQKQLSMPLAMVLLLLLLLSRCSSAVGQPTLPACTSVAGYVSVHLQQWEALKVFAV
jgi:hypothetical protein